MQSSSGSSLAGESFPRSPIRSVHEMTHRTSYRGHATGIGSLSGILSPTFHSRCRRCPAGFDKRDLSPDQIHRLRVRVHVRLSRKCARKDPFLVMHPESVGGDHRHWSNFPRSGPSLLTHIDVYSVSRDLNTRTAPRCTNRRFSVSQSKTRTKVSLFRLQCLKRI
jgi:hypothetical protein